MIARRSTPGPASGSRHRQGDAAGALALARAGVALQPRRAEPVQRASGQPDPHAAVDLGDAGPLADERAQRARRGLDHGDAVANLGDRRMEAELPDGRTETLDAGRERLRRSQAYGSEQLVGEVEAERAEPAR